MTAMERDNFQKNTERHVQVSQEALAAMSEFESALKGSEVIDDAGDALEAFQQSGVAV